ncbi:MAG: UbiA family prenyltransferase [Alphaproteobacteria bacterium GM202ARS2]|nr:UbiA family prenyltransferase [Alphaproteobacteria bacterium GM202ARS2]
MKHDIATSSLLLRATPPQSHPYLLLMRLDRPIGIVLLMLPCFWGLALTHTRALYLYGLFALGAFLMRSAGCIINDIIDQKTDALIQRTQTRPLPAGLITTPQALVLLALILCCALAVLLALPAHILLPTLATVPFIILYPFIKRVSFYPQVFLACLFNSPLLLAAYASLPPNHPLIPSLIPAYLSAILFTVAYDTVYAHMDIQDDRRVGVKSLAIKLGRHTRQVLYGLYALSFLLLAGMIAPTLPSTLLLATAAITQLVCLSRLHLDDFASCLRFFQQQAIILLLIFFALLSH